MEKRWQSAWKLYRTLVLKRLIHAGCQKIADAYPGDQLAKPAVSQNWILKRPSIKVQLGYMVTSEAACDT